MTQTPNPTASAPTAASAASVNAEDEAAQQALARSTLQHLRESIDNIDAALVFMLAERFKITQQVGVFKKHYKLPPADPRREQEQISRLRDLALSAKLDPEFSKKFLQFIIKEVIRHHEQIRSEDDSL